MQRQDTYGNSGHTRPIGERVIYWLTILLCIASLLVAVALGAKVQTGGTGKYFTFGIIEDFGSIVVNGVHYDDSLANIIIDGVPNQPRSALKLGMVVEIEGQRNYALNTGIAEIVRANRTLLGQVQSFNNQTGELRVLSQIVVTNQNTRYFALGGPDQLAMGSWVAIHGLSDPAQNSLVATLIELVDLPVASNSEIRGEVRNARDGRFRIGQLNISAQDARVEDGDFVAVKGTYNPDAGELTASSVVATPEIEVHENAGTEIDGYASDVRSKTDFMVSGILVDGSRATISGGTANDIKQGVRLVVEGTMRSGVLIAEEIEIQGVAETTQQKRKQVTEVEGIVNTVFAPDEFAVGNTRISAAGARVTNKYNLPLAVGVKVHVKGRQSAEGSIVATTIVFEKS